jgi:aminoglycoside phosphotransferase (APT) family kinase protein
LPAVVDYDGEEGALILQAPAGARDLTHHHARGRFSCGLARQAGRALAALHELDPGVAAGLPGRVEPAAGTCLHRLDLEEVHARSTAALELTEVIQRSEELCAGLDELGGSWSPQSTIHGDVRWDNLLTMSPARSHRWTGLQLIDWEHAAPGEPGLDVGAFLGEYLRVWVGSIPIVDPRDPGRLLSQARMPLSSMRPAIHAFWDAYASHRSHATADLNLLRERSVRFAAVRLLSAAMEEAQTHGELEPGVFNLVPVSRNILMHPNEASAHLLGLDVNRHAA